MQSNAGRREGTLYSYRLYYLTITVCGLNSSGVDIFTTYCAKILET